jgi:large subunit ribosomal protein L31
MRYRFTSAATGARRGDPAAARTRSLDMKPDIHPDYVVTTVTCTCGNTFTTRSTAPGGVIHADICSNCHPFYTGKQKILDTGGRVARFERRFGKKQSGDKK